MDRNKMVLTCVGIVTFGLVTVAVTGLHLYYYHGRMKNMDTDTNTTVFDKYNHCLSLVLDKSRENNKPCNAEEAERVCAKFNSAK